MFEWKEFIKRFRQVQYDEKAVIRDLQLQVDDLNSNFKLVADYFGISDDRLLELETALGPHGHDDRYYTEAEADSLLAGKSDITHNHDGRYYTESEIDAMLAGLGGSTDPWECQVIGSPIGLWTDIVGTVEPSKVNPKYRYVKLTYADAYNSGILVSEGITGAAPNQTAVGTISLAGSPINGRVVPLINTDRRFLRAGSPGTKQASQNLAHIHTGSTDNTGSHTHTGSTNTTGAHTHAIATGAGGGGVAGTTSGASLYSSLPTSSAGNHAHSLSIVAAGAHTHSLSIATSGGDESRPSNIGVTYFMRIL